jgi:aerobic carbon-monoxide dehydrogenase medium subunit
MPVGALLHPASIAEAVALLAADGDGRCLAGGATLVAMMNARLVTPSRLVSLAGIDELRGIAAAAEGGLRIGAMTRHGETAGDARLAGSAAVIRSAAGQIANPVIRNMGTIGGSIAFADPAADYPPALVAAAAEIEIAGRQGRRRIKAEDFFVDWYQTALEPDEIVTAVLVPPAPKNSYGQYHKLARVSGDFAIASVALCLAVEAGRVSALRVAVGGCGPRPVRSAAAESTLVGARLAALDTTELGAALAEAADPVDDVRASAAYRRLVIPRLLRRAVAEAVAAVGATP